MKQSKSVKLGLENIITGYYQVTEVFESVLNIQQHAGRKNDIHKVKMTCRLKQPTKNVSNTKIKEKNTFSEYLTILTDRSV